MDAHDVDHVLSELKSGIAVEENFKRLFDWHYQTVHVFFVRCGCSPEEALDLTQETFVRAYRGLQSYCGDASFTGWLLRIATNVYRNAVRQLNTWKRSGVEVPIEATDAEFLTSEERVPVLDALSRERVGHLEAAIKELPPQIRRVLILHAYHGHSYGDIAEILGVSVETVKSHLLQGRKRLRNVLE